MRIRLEKILKSKSFLLIGIVVMMLSISNALHAEDIIEKPLSITHSLNSYTNDGPTITLEFTLNITNNSKIVCENSSNADWSYGG